MGNVEGKIIEFRTKNQKQIDAAEAWLNDLVDEILYGGAKYGGKTYLGCSLIFGDALIYPGTHYFIARHTLADLRKHTIPSIHERFQHWKLDMDYYAKFNGQDNVYNLYNGSKVYLLECKELPSDPLFERFGSMQMTRGWIEEGGEIAADAKANLALSIGRWKNEEYKLKKKLLITANPKKGWMKREFVEPHKTGDLPQSKVYIQAFATDNVHGSADYVAALKNEKDPVRRQRLWEGSWDYDEDKDSLISYDALIDAFTNTITLDGGKYLIVDVARLGRDETVFSFWEGLEKYKVKKFSKQTTDVTIQKVKDDAVIEKIPWSHILIDEDGIGGAVVDGLPGVKGFIANSTPIPTAEVIRERESKVDHFLIPKTSFANLKSQCGWKLAELINEHKVAFQVPQYREAIVEELTAMLRNKDVDSDGKKQLRSKEDVKEEIGHSPDVGDTILMRMYFELVDLVVAPVDQTVVDRQDDIAIRNRNRQNQNSSK